MAGKLSSRLSTASLDEGITPDDDDDDDPSTAQEYAEFQKWLDSGMESSPVPMRDPTPAPAPPAAKKDTCELCKRDPCIWF